MKYIIVAKNDYDGTSSSDKANPLQVTEICSELIITRLFLLDCLSNGQISNEDTIVTIDERMCLYINIFKNVITYKQFCDTILTSEDIVVDLLNNSMYDQMAIGGLIPYKPFYQHYDRDKKLIDNVNWSDMSEYDLRKPFICLVIRKRGAWLEKNLSDKYWLELIENLKKIDIQVFVFGRETETFCDDKQIKHIKNFRDWCTLVKHKNCKHIFSTMTGGVYPAMIFGAPNMKMTIVDNTKLMDSHRGDPSFYDDCVNFSKVDINFVYEIPTIEEILKMIIPVDDTKNIFEYIILGGGITGVGAARVLQQKGENNFILLESNDEPGGLCRTKHINGHHFDIGGGHVLHSKYPEVLDWIFEHIPKSQFNKFDTKVLIDLEGHPVEFPIELNLWQLPTELQVEYVMSYLKAAGNGKIEYKNFEDWIRNYLGDKIADNYMIPYNKKLWCIDISTLNTDWLVKIPETDLKLVLKTIIEKKSNFTEEVVSHKSFYYPKEGGFQTIFDSIYDNIKEHVRLGVKVSNLAYNKETELWTIDGKYTTKKIICTIPWTSLKIVIEGFDYTEEFKNLDYLSDVISLWEREPYNHDAHWKYIPNPDVEQHREFYIHNFAPHSKPGGVMTDINRKRWLANDKKWKAGIPLYEHENIYSYPLPTKVYKESMKKILNFSKDYNLFGLGRWGQWQYFNTDQCIKQCIEFFKDERGFDYFQIF